MRIGIVGAGMIGSTVAKLWVDAGHEVRVSSRHPSAGLLFGGRPLRSTTAELIRVKRYKFANAHRRSARHPLDAVRHPVIPTRPMQLGHGHEVVQACVVPGSLNT